MDDKRTSGWGVGDDPGRRVKQHIHQEFQEWVGTHQENSAALLANTAGVPVILPQPCPPPPEPHKPLGAPLRPRKEARGVITDMVPLSARQWRKSQGVEGDEETYPDWRSWSGEECAEWMMEVVNLPEYYVTAKQNLSGRLLGRLTASALPNLGVNDLEAQRIIMDNIRQLKAGETTWRPGSVAAQAPLSERTSRPKPSTVRLQSFGAGPVAASMPQRPQSRNQGQQLLQISSIADAKTKAQRSVDAMQRVKSGGLSGRNRPALTRLKSSNELVDGFLCIGFGGQLKNQIDTFIKDKSGLIPSPTRHDVLLNLGKEFGAMGSVPPASPPTNMNEGTCARCAWLQEDLIRSSNCAHRLCVSCDRNATRTGPWDKHLVVGSGTIKDKRECPICHEEWSPLRSPKGLVGMCISALRQRAAKHSAESVARLPAPLRTQVLQDHMAVAPLGVAKITAWLAGTTIDTLVLSGMYADSLPRVAPCVPFTVRHLVLSGVNPSDEQLRAMLSQCGQHLRQLECDLLPDAKNDSQLAGTCLVHAANLQKVDLSFHKKLTPSSLIVMLNQCGSRLISVKIPGCSLANEEVFKTLAICDLLEVLDISCTYATADDLEEILVACPFLHVLSISDCLKLDGDRVCQVCAVTALNLEEFTVGGVPHLTDDGLRDLLDSPIAPHFRKLNLSRQKDITDDSVRLIPRWCKALEALELDMCTGISMKALQRLVLELPRLEVFPLRMIRDTGIKSSLTYILRSRGHENAGEWRAHEHEENALRSFVTQNEDSGGTDFARVKEQSSEMFKSRLEDSVPTYRDPCVTDFYQAPRRRVGGRLAAHRCSMNRTSFATTKQLHKWLESRIFDPIDEAALAQLKHLVLLKPSLGIFKGQTALHLLIRNSASKYSDLLQAVRCLVEHHANPDIIESKHGLSPLLSACYLQSPNAVRALIEVTSCTERSHFVHCGSVYDPALTAQMLHNVRRGQHDIPEGANLDARDRAGLQAVHIAASAGSVLGVRGLLERGVDPNALDACGRTPLWWACRMGEMEVIAELLQDERTNPSIPSLPMGGLPECTPIRVAALCDQGEAADAVREALGIREWSELESEIRSADKVLGGADPAQACKRWLHDAFCAHASTKPWSGIAQVDDQGRSVPPRNDKWQLRSLITEAGEVEEQERGRVVASHLLVPIMKLAADLSLKGPPKALLEYLFQQGIPRYDLSKVMEISEEVLSKLGFMADEFWEELSSLPDLHLAVENLPAGKDNLLNQAKAWGGVHQAFAHGPLPWLEKDQSIAACHALMENGALQSAEDIVEWAGTLGSKNLLALRFWASVYDVWLMGEAKRVNAVAQRKLSDLVESLDRETKRRVQYHAGPLKKLKRVQQKKVEYGSLAPIVELQEADGEFNSDEYIAYLHEVSAGLGTMQDRMAAGGACDLVRATLECEDEDAAVEVVKVALDRNRAEHGLEAMRLKNGFHKDVPAGSYRDIKIIFLCQDQDVEGRPFRHLIECQILLKNFLALKSCQHAAYRVVRGEFGVPVPGGAEDR